MPRGGNFAFSCLQTSFTTLLRSWRDPVDKEKLPAALFGVYGAMCRGFERPWDHESTCSDILIMSHSRIITRR